LVVSPTVVRLEGVVDVELGSSTFVTPSVVATAPGPVVVTIGASPDRVLGDDAVLLTSEGCSVLSSLLVPPEVVDWSFKTS
jgi:hypothetical protein